MRFVDGDVAKPTPGRPSTGSPGTGKPTGRPTTTATLADRYKPAAPRGGDGPQVKPTNPALTPRPKGGDSKSADGKPRTSTGPTLADRYVPAGTRPRDTVPPGGSNNNPTVGTRPTLSPRPAANGTRGTVPPIGSPNGAPHLNPRPRNLATTVSHPTSGGSCYGPVWDPCHSWSSGWYGHCSPGLTWCFGIGYGSFCWGWGSWYPWSCYSNWCYGYGYGYGSWWNPWCYPYASPVYGASYAPVYLYPDPEPSSVVVIEGEHAGDEAIDVGKSRELSPREQARRYIDLGDFYFREGRFREAADTYARARTLMPDEATVHFVLADAVFALGDYHFAAYLIGEALRLEPGLATADTDKRLLYGDPKLFETQMQTLVRYVEEKPYDAMAHLVLGYNLKFSGKPVEAEKALRRVLEIDPGSNAAALLLAALSAPAKPPAEKAPAAPTEKAPAPADKPK